MAKFVTEDAGSDYGRTWNWPAIPEGLFSRLAASDSSTVVCALCGNPWGGLIYDPDTETFRHRKICRRISFESGR